MATYLPLALLQVVNVSRVYSMHVYFLTCCIERLSISRGVAREHCTTSLSLANLYVVLRSENQRHHVSAGTIHYMTGGKPTNRVKPR